MTCHYSIEELRGRLQRARRGASLSASVDLLEDHLAAREKLRELEPRPLREGDEWMYDGGTTIVVGPAYFGGPRSRIVRIPIPSSAAPPAETDTDGAATSAGFQTFDVPHPARYREPLQPEPAAPPAEEKPSIVQQVFDGEGERQLAGLDETMRGLPAAPPRQPEKARAFAVGDRVRVIDNGPGTVRETEDCYEDHRTRVGYDNGAQVWHRTSDLTALPADPAEKDAPRCVMCGQEAPGLHPSAQMGPQPKGPAPISPLRAMLDGFSRRATGEAPMTATKAHMKYMAPKLRLEHLQVDLARTIDASTEPLRKSLRTIVETSCEVDTVRRAALALLGGGGA